MKHGGKNHDSIHDGVITEHIWVHFHISPPHPTPPHQKIKLLLFCCLYIQLISCLLCCHFCFQIKQPILFLSGLQDEMVPAFHMQLLYAKAAAHNRQCLFVDFPNGMHMNTWLSGGDRYWRTVKLFLEQRVPGDKEERESSQDGTVSGHLTTLPSSHKL